MPDHINQYQLYLIKLSICTFSPRLNFSSSPTLATRPSNTIPRYIESKAPNPNLMEGPPSLLDEEEMLMGEEQAEMESPRRPGRQVCCHLTSAR